MKSHFKHLVPVLFAFSEEAARQEAWGRFVELAATGGRLLTRFSLTRGERLQINFDLPGEHFATPARVSRARRDLDGYYVAELRFLDEVVKKKLCRALTKILAS